MNYDGPGRIMSVLIGAPVLAIAVTFALLAVAWEHVHCWRTGESFRGLRK